MRKPLVVKAVGSACEAASPNSSDALTDCLDRERAAAGKAALRPWTSVAVDVLRLTPKRRKLVASIVIESKLRSIAIAAQSPGHSQGSTFHFDRMISL